MRQHNIWCVCVRSVWRGMLDSTYLSIQDARTHTKRYAAASPHWLFTFLTNFKISNFIKEHMSSLKMIWIRSKHVGAFLSVLMCAESGTHLHTERTYTHQMLCCRITTLTFTFLTNFKISNFNKKHMSLLKMIWIRSKHVVAFLSVLMWTF